MPRRTPLHIAVTVAKIQNNSNFRGIAALLSMLNGCASGVSVVNIGNEFGTECSVSIINKL